MLGKSTHHFHKEQAAKEEHPIPSLRARTSLSIYKTGLCIQLVRG
jgi:hypothetical protein